MNAQENASAETHAPAARPSNVAPAEKGSDTIYFPGLTGLRTIAFLMVFCVHMIPTVPDKGLGSHWLMIFKWSGSYGVTLFFALSSFLITTLLFEEKARTHTVDIKKFYFRRILRIWPVFYLMIAVAVVTNIFVLKAPIHWPLILRFCTFTGNFGLSVEDNNAAPAAIGVLWSVCVEEQFYLIWPLVVRFCSKRLVTAVSIGIILIGIGFRASMAGHIQADVVWSNSLGHLDCFGYGALASMYLRGRKFAPDWATGAGIAALFVGLYALEGVLPYKSMGAGVVRLGGMIDYTLLAIACALIVWLASTLRSGLLVSKPMVAMGQITYGLYAYHIFANRIMLRAVPRLETSPLLAAVGTLALSIAIAAASYKYFEAPFLKLKTRMQLIRSNSS